MTRFLDLPVDLLLDNLIPLLRLPDLLSLTSTCKFFYVIGEDDIFWKRKLKEDYNFDGKGTARNSGWKFIYRGLRNPQIYVWGNPGNGRLGLGDIDRDPVPSPRRLRIKGSSVVDLVAGGWSFHALDSAGSIYAWGQLQDGFAGTNEGFSAPSKKTDTPIKLEFPNELRVISLRCSRSFALAMDQNHQIWTFMSWGRPYRLTSDSLSPDNARIVQIECGWNFGAVLTDEGQVLIWWPESGAFGEALEESTRLFDSQIAENDAMRCKAVNGVVKCMPWDLNLGPVSLPRLPNSLPPLRPIPNDDALKLVKIAAGENFIIGLTNAGHVLTIGLDDEGLRPSGSWEYLPNFCDGTKVRENGAFAEQNVPVPENIQITHISAHFRDFVAYSPGSSSIVLLSPHGEAAHTTANVHARIIGGLQNRSVISVHLGDYHYGALTSDGKLLTWGQFSTGALGLGDPAQLPVGAPGGYATEEEKANAVNSSWRFFNPPNVETPSEVKFGNGKNKYCFAAAAGGWHFGALVIDLEPGNEEEVEPPIHSDSDRHQDGRRAGRHLGILPHGPQAANPTPIAPPLMPGFGHFRIGFAGRGRGRGGPNGRGRGA
ncbi:RCC1/BLIP-II protein [Sistotremastrum niveocremeum HHB9708]|uniref:RCC1/BLIP-II protein n=1 Tax=Sistotremastrum niveocremeum HHB9708 TaxID=1314777 RepID=A0A164RQB2_9AGAM|nr:RCC1/BLIP-II protein [Sistotremastrum niveocremeum HHB9708]